MKKLLVLLLCLIMCVCFVSCEYSVAPDSNESNTERPSAPDKDTQEDNKLPKEQSSLWKTAYLDFLETKKDSHLSYTLVYVDGDDIPELYLSGVCEAEGDSICSYKNGIVIEQSLNRTGGGKYIERSGNIINQNGHMGLCYTDVYKLNENGFTKTLNALSKERVEDLGNGEYNTFYEYSIAGEAVSEEAYNAAVNSSFDFTQSVRFNENAVSYDVIKQQISDCK